MNVKRLVQWTLVLCLALSALAGVLFLSPAKDYMKAASLLIEMQNQQQSPWFVHAGGHAVQEEMHAFDGSGGRIRYRIFRPVGVAHPPGLVLVHGVHHLGIEEPRQVRFARAFAERGLLVMTPEIKDMTDYRILPSAIAVIGDSAHLLRDQLGAPVGVMGLSFSGSLALMAAAEPRYAGDIRTVIALGAYDDLERVSRFLVTEQIELPDGSRQRHEAEQYGALVLVYTYAKDFFTPQDLPAAHDALRLWLWEQYDAARLREKDSSPPAQARLEALFRHQMDVLQPELLASVARHADEMQRVSPSGKLASLQARVFLLHGEEDDVIPSSEAHWLAHDLPAPQLARLLITPAIGHVDPSTRLSWQSLWKVISFIAGIFRQLEASQHAS